MTTGNSLNNTFLCSFKSKILIYLPNLTFVFRANPEAFRQDLINIARTTLSSKVLSQDKDYFANLAVDAVLRLKVKILTSIFREY